MKKLVLFSAGLLVMLFTFSATHSQQTHNSHNAMDSQKLEEATLGAGCFWCVEAIFEEVKGVKSVVAGYAGGEIPDPTYKQVSTGRTGHAEVTRITYDPAVVSFEQLLEVFWHTHNPTTKNRQGADVGPQYRSVIFYHSDEQKEVAQQSLQRTEESGLWEDPIVTEIEPLTNYSDAENYHQNFYANNPNNSYCSVVIAPKLKKFRKEFAHMLKSKTSQSE